MIALRQLVLQERSHMPTWAADDREVTLFGGEISQRSQRRLDPDGRNSQPPRGKGQTFAVNIPALEAPFGRPEHGFDQAETLVGRRA